MEIRFRIVGVAVAVLLVIIFLSFRFLTRRLRFVLYGVILAAAIGTWLYVTTSLNPTTGVTLSLYRDGLAQPVQALWGPDGSERFFVVERGGQIRIIEDGKIKESPFLDIEDRVDSEGAEQGLLSLAFHPDFSQNGTFYIYYSALNDDMTLERYQISAADPDVADAGSGVKLLTIPQFNSHHNGGTILFGPDDYLYLGIGNGGDEEMGPGSVSQDLTNYLGTIVRLDVANLDVPYQVPADNPFVDKPDALPEIWAYGLRNPWRMMFDHTSGDLYIADVGEKDREEINIMPLAAGSGVNYGWPFFEGNNLTAATGAEDVNPDDFVFPVAEYDHLALGGCSIIGGELYHGETFPALQGKYLYGDFCSGFIWALALNSKGKGESEVLLRDQTVRLSSMAADGAGEIYLLDVGAGRMLKLVEE